MSKFPINECEKAIGATFHDEICLFHYQGNFHAKHAAEFSYVISSSTFYFLLSESFPRPEQEACKSNYLVRFPYYLFGDLL